jgi:general secretion pathway protein D
MAAATLMPVIHAHAQDSSYLPTGSSLAEREAIRRQKAVADADQFLAEARAAYTAKDYEKAVARCKESFNTLPPAPILDDRRAVIKAHLLDASVALASQQRKVGKYNEARELLTNPIFDSSDARIQVELGYLDDPVRTNPALTYEHTQNVDKVRRALYMGEGHYNLGKYDDAMSEFESVLRIDPHNKTARRWMEKIAVTKSDYYRSAYDQTRAELLMQVDKTWELAVSRDAPIAGNTGTIDPRLTSGSALLMEKLRSIIIPVIEFEDTSVEEAIDFLRNRTRELDTTTNNPADKGINFVVRKPQPGSAAPAADAAGLDAAAGGLAVVADPGAVRVKELRLTNVPVATALKYICDSTKLKYKVDDYAVTLVPASEDGEDIVTRSFQVPPDFLDALSDGGSTTETTTDPFAASAETGGGGGLRPRGNVQDLLKAKGVPFPEKASANFIAANSTLVVRNTPTNLDLIEQIVTAMQSDTPKQIKIMTKFVEISQENNDELGFDWIVSPFGLGADMFAGGGTIGSGAARSISDFINPVAGTPINGIPTVSGQSVSNIMTAANRSGNTAITRDSISALLNNPGRTSQNAAVAPGILSLTGLFSDGQVQMIMRGLSQKKGADMMTAPSIMAKSGQKATIEIIREFIYPTEYEPPELPQNIGGGFNGNNGGGIGGGGGGGGSFPVTPATPTAFEPRNTGVTLEIEPTLAGNNSVIDLRFAPEIVEFEGFINYGSPIQAPSTNALGDPTTVTITENRIEMPVFSVRRVSTSLSIYDGHTVAVGGLMREDVQNVEDKIPILGDIPLVGRLFQTKAENRIKSNLIIFVTAQIIDATGRTMRADGLVENSTAQPDLIAPGGENTAVDGSAGVLPVP